jgi:diguanylate cyclase (GGDEF)-like protein/PAS domain S-box-containing protein
MQFRERLTGFFRNHSGAAVIILGFGVVVALMGWLTLSSLSRLDAIRTDIAQIVTQHNEHAGLLRKMYQTTRDRSLLLQKIISESDAFERDELAVRVDELGTEFARLRSRFLQLELHPAERELLERQGEASANTKPLQYKVIELAMQGNQAEAQRVLVQEAMPAQDAALSALNDLLGHQDTEIKMHAEKAYQREKAAYAFLLAGGGGSILLSIAIAFYVRWQIRKLITRLMATSKTLEENARELKYQKIALDEHAIVSICDSAGKITYANEKFTQISQYSLEELIGQDHRLLNSHFHPPEFFNEMWRAIACGVTWHGQVRNRRKDGSFYWVKTTIVPFLDEQRRPYQYVSVRTDITPIKEAEEVLSRSKEELEQMVAEQTAELRAREAEMQRLASTDPLTGIANRRKFNDELEKELERAQRHGLPVALIIMDIDHFKHVNDTFGHPVGDSVLVEFARTIEGNIRANDVFARWGGEEFIVLAPHVDADNLRILAEKLRGAVEAFDFTEVGPRTCSIGATTYQPGESVQELIARVDGALYMAKQGGRNRVEQL